MGKGIDLAKAENPELVAALEDFKDQLFIVMLNRLGGKVSIPVSEADDTGGYLVAMNIDQGIFNFEVRKKQ